ncbi:COG4 transport protein-domain-containing protein [Schizophyllum amplum]|uniref:Conserved oligomeric Golgi complex subunit 4 n=1 Tax=Schizophyllum amplum TaxID=97359 RepID=A0A550CAH8_9AGAR|nr:COG4 transport protein-domain-containing protein [Auriculariopsis ampla]
MASPVSNDVRTSVEQKTWDPRTLTSLPEIFSCLSAFQSEEAELSNSLTTLLSAREPIVASLNRLDDVLPHIEVLRDEALVLSARVSSTAQTAERIGGRVSSLDEEMRRIRDAGDRVAQVMQLKDSLAEVQASIDAQDWESATRHCARAMALPLEVISGPFSEVAVPTPESHLPPAQTLQAAREQLLAVFRRNFEKASSSMDSAGTSRFFKLFPAIGWEEEGLKAYAAFVTGLVRVRAPASVKTSSPLYYITALTALFESVAMIADQHQPVVEKYYGPGKMKSVVEKLLEECDRTVESLISGWEEERSLQRKLSNVTNHPPTPLYYGGTSRQQQPPQEDVDPREIDKVVSEAAGMVSRWNVFRKFLCETMQTNEEALRDEEADETDALGDARMHERDDAVCEAYIALESTAAHRQFAALLSSYYIPMDLAHRLSTIDSSQSPPITTTPDDVFYVLKVVLTRLLATGSLPHVERMLGHLREIMERDYAGVIKRKLDDVYRTSNGGNDRATKTTERAERDSRVSFIVLLNDLDVSSSHLERLVLDLNESLVISQHFIAAQQLAVKDCLSGFATLTTRLRSNLRTGIDQLFNQLLRPKLRNFIPEMYRDVTYVLDEDAYSVSEYQDTVRKRFVKAWESLLDGYKDTFTLANYSVFYSLLLDVIVRPWEKFLMTLKFTELGAIRFDRDLRAIVHYIASQTTFGDVREKFVRLQQVSTLLNLDAEEDVDEFYNGSGIMWKLSSQEARTIVGLRI